MCSDLIPEGAKRSKFPTAYGFLRIESLTPRHGWAQIWAMGDCLLVHMLQPELLLKATVISQTH